MSRRIDLAVYEASKQFDGDDDHEVENDSSAAVMYGGWVREMADRKAARRKVFLATQLTPCDCGNRVRPKIEIVQDMSARIECPTVRCDYCGNDAGLFCGERYAECLEAWEKVARA